MTSLDDRRIPLPMLGRTHGTRSPVTCHLKCADACFHPVPNQSANPTFREIASAALSRRTVLRGAGAGVLALVVGGALGAAPEADAARSAGSGASPPGRTAVGEIRCRSVRLVGSTRRSTR